MGVGSVQRLDASSFGSRLYLARLRRVQDAFTSRLHADVPGASVERRYGVVLDALALRLPGARAGPRRGPPRRGGRLPGRDLPRRHRHRARARGRDPALGRRRARPPVRASRSGSSTTASTPARRSSGRTACAPPPGFPRGQRRFTSGRVIVARSFAGRRRAATPTTSPSIRTSRSTARTSRASSPAPTEPSRGPGSGCRSCTGLSGVAPGAWLGNYRGLARGDHESGRHRLDGRARRRGRQGRRGRHGRAQPLARRPGDRPCGRCPVAGAGQCRARRHPLGRRRGQRASTRAGYGSISSPGTSATAITVAATSTHARLRGQRAPSAATARPRSRRSRRCRRSGRA